MAELEIAINSRLRDLLHTGHVQDLDSFGLRFSKRVAALLSDGYPSELACKTALVGFRTQFFRLNRLKRESFAKEFAAKIADVKPKRGLADYVLDFKRFAERQLVTELKAARDEETFRSLLQTFLAGNYVTYREVESGGGRSDILIVDRFNELIEAKLWKGFAYFDDGLTELATYLGTESLARGYYVNLEFGEAGAYLAKQGSDQWVVNRMGKTIEVTFVRVPAVSPSKIGREGRATGRKVQDDN